jgi:hypothetical protein
VGWGEREENPYAILRDSLQVQRDLLVRVDLLVQANAEITAGLRGIGTQVGALIAALSPPQPGPPHRLTLSIKGVVMPGKITIDTVGEKVYLGAADRLGEPTDLPAGVTTVFSTDNAALLTAAAETAEAPDPVTGKNSLVADLTILGAGTANVSATDPVDANGAPLLEADGVTPIPAPAPVPVAVDPGAPVGLRLSLNP